MDGMSLIPSESASFPDLVGQRHGYLPPNVRHRSRRSHKEATRPSHPTLSNSLEENRAVAQSDTEIGQPSVSIEPLERIDTLKEPAAHGPRAEQFELPTNAPAELEPLEEVVALTNAPADGESPERLKLPKTKVSEPSHSIRAALPIPPQRSSAQMRAAAASPQAGALYRVRSYRRRCSDLRDGVWLFAPHHRRSAFVVLENSCRRGRGRCRHCAGSLFRFARGISAQRTLKLPENSVAVSLCLALMPIGHRAPYARHVYTESERDAGNPACIPLNFFATD